jgi:hypothetical protein
MVGAKIRCMDTITIARIEREGQTLVIDPPFVLSVRPTTVIADGVTPYAYWEARVDKEPAHVRDDGRSDGERSQRTGWFAARDLTPRALTPTREDLETEVIEQLWYWWDHVIWEDNPRLAPLQKVAHERLRQRMKEVNA